MNERGFTLVEVIMVIALMAIMLAIAAPSFFSWQESAQYKEVARDILSGLRNARSIAVTENKTVIATIDIENHRLTYDTTIKNLSDKVSLETRIDTASAWSTDNTDDDGDSDMSNTRRSTFSPNGSCTDELYVRINSDDSLIVSITSPATGLARLP